MQNHRVLKMILLILKKPARDILFHYLKQWKFWNKKDLLFALQISAKCNNRVGDYEGSGHLHWCLLSPNDISNGIQEDIWTRFQSSSQGTIHQHKSLKNSTCQSRLSLWILWYDTSIVWFCRCQYVLCHLSPLRPLSRSNKCAGKNYKK